MKETNMEHYRGEIEAILNKEEVIAISKLDGSIFAFERQVIRMREILFRGKELKNEKWIEGSLLVLDADSGYYFITEPYKSASTLPVKDLIYNHTHLVNPETVCQFTGLTDENGKQIFEGDIVKGLFLFGMSINAVVIFKDGSFGLKWYRGSIEEFSPLSCFHNVTFEVIGNIFDNPELMEGGAK